MTFGEEYEAPHYVTFLTSLFVQIFSSEASDGGGGGHVACFMSRGHQLRQAGRRSSDNAFDCVQNERCYYSCDSLNISKIYAYIA